jgi:2',3'-cyclic-nucleotide 2'-phosphodiesterase/3'-nucleotidase
VALIGVTTIAVPWWEKPENYAGYRFENAAQAVKRTLAGLAERPDLVIVAAHTGIGGGADAENGAGEIAATPGVDAIVFGHTHQEVADRRIGGVLLAQPKNWGMSLARLDFTLEGGDGKPWRVVEKSGSLIKVTDETPADPAILEIARPFHEAAERYLSKPVARSEAALDGTLGRVADSALVDAIHEVQMHYAKADVSFTSLLNPRASVPKGAVTVRQIASLYIYLNDLYAVEGDGKMVKDALENAARYFVSCTGEGCGKGPLVDRTVYHYNFDMAQGVNYEIDLTKPVGSRILNLTYKGEPLRPDRKLRIAVNSYRAGGSAGYTMFRDAKIVWRSAEDIRRLMIDYFTERGKLPEKPDGNWRIVPELARATLERDALAEAARSSRF